MRELLTPRVLPLGAALVATYAGACQHPSTQGVASSSAEPTRESPPSTALPVRASPRAIAEAIFDGGLKPGWQDWGWAPREVNGPGPAKVRFDNWGGWILAKPEGLPGAFGGVLFRAKQPAGEGEFIEVRLEASSGSKFPR